jgi:hypothetical protein
MMTREQIVAARDRALESYDRLISEAKGVQLQKMQADREALAKDFDDMLNAL